MSLELRVAPSGIYGSVLPDEAVMTSGRSHCPTHARSAMAPPPDHGMMNDVHSASCISPIYSCSSRPSAERTFGRRMRTTLAVTGAVLMLAVGCSSGGQLKESAVTGDTAVDEVTAGSIAEGADGVELRDVVFDVRRDPG